MRIQAKQLSSHLKNSKSLAPLYLIFGEEPLQRLEAGDMIRLTAKEQGFEERSIFDLSANTDFEGIIAAQNTLSLFSSKRVIECRLSDGKIGKKGSEALIQLANTPSPDVLLLFIFDGKPETQITQTAWFKTLERLGVAIVANLPLGKDLSLWLSARLKEAGLNTSDNALHALQRRTEGNLLAAANTIEKLRLCHDSEKLIEEQDIIEAVGEDARFSLFSLTDTILSGSVARTIQIFESLTNEGVDLILILWVLTREVRTIIPLARLTQEGRLQRGSLQEHGVWQHRVGLMSSFLERCSLDTLYQSLLTAKSIDSLIKNHKPSAARLALLSLVVTLSGVSDNV